MIVCRWKGAEVQEAQQHLEVLLLSKYEIHMYMNFNQLNFENLNIVVYVYLAAAPLDAGAHPAEQARQWSQRPLAPGREWRWIAQVRAVDADPVDQAVGRAAGAGWIMSPNQLRLGAHAPQAGRGRRDG